MPAVTRPPEEKVFPGPDDPVPPRSLARVYTESELDRLEPPNYLLDGIIPERSLGFVAGVPNSGKSLIVLDWCMTLARGWDWYGRESVQRNVVYLTSEGSTNFNARIQAWRKNREASQANRHFTVVFDQLMLGGDPTTTYDDRARVEALLAEKEAGVLVIDPMVNYFSGSAKDEQNAINLTKWCQSLVAEGTVVIIVHHVAKAGGSRGGGLILRDSGAFAGAADWVFEMDATFEDERDDAVGLKYSTLIPHKIKDGDWPSKMQFILEQIEVEAATRRLDGAVGTSVVLRYRGVQVRAEENRDKVLRVIREGGGMSGNAVAVASSLRREVSAEVIRQLAEEGVIKDVSTTNNPKWIVGEGPESL